MRDVQWSADRGAEALLQVSRIFRWRTRQRIGLGVQCRCVRGVVEHSVRLIEVEPAPTAAQPHSAGSWEPTSSRTSAGTETATTRASGASGTTRSSEAALLVAKILHTAAQFVGRHAKHIGRRRRTRYGDGLGRDGWRNTRHRHAGRSHRFAAALSATGAASVRTTFSRGHRQRLKSASTASCVRIAGRALGARIEHNVEIELMWCACGSDFKRLGCRREGHHLCAYGVVAGRQGQLVASVNLGPCGEFLPSPGVGGGDSRARNSRVPGSHPSLHDSGGRRDIRLRRCADPARFVRFWCLGSSSTRGHRNVLRLGWRDRW